MLPPKDTVLLDIVVVVPKLLNTELLIYEAVAAVPLNTEEAEPVHALNDEVDNPPSAADDADVLSTVIEEANEEDAAVKLAIEA